MIPGAPPTFFCNDQGPLSQHGRLCESAGFQSSPVQSSMFRHASLQAVIMSTSCTRPLSTFVFRSSVHLTVQSAVYEKIHNRLHVYIIDIHKNKSDFFRPGSSDITGQNEKCKCRVDCFEDINFNYALLGKYYFVLYVFFRDFNLCLSVCLGLFIRLYNF